MSAIQDGLTSLWDVLDMKTSLLGLTAAYAAWRVYVVVSGLRVCPAMYVSRAWKLTFCCCLGTRWHTKSTFCIRPVLSFRSNSACLILEPGIELPMDETTHLYVV